MPSVPPAAIVPRNSGSLVFALFDFAHRDGADRRGGGDARSRHRGEHRTGPIFACIRPPGSQDTHSTSALYIRSAIPERSRISPRQDEERNRDQQEIVGGRPADLAQMRREAERSNRRPAGSAQGCRGRPRPGRQARAVTSRMAGVGAEHQLFLAMRWRRFEGCDFLLDVLFRRANADQLRPMPARSPAFSLSSASTNSATPTKNEQQASR